MRKTRAITLTATFSALHAVLGFLSLGIGWRNWAVYLEPFEGVILGPKIGFFTALIGSSIARMAGLSSDWMFGIIAEPLSVLMAGFLSKAKWKPVLTIYGVMLSAYFIAPLGRALPIWTILDILFALLLIYPCARLGSNLFGTNARRLPIALALISFVTIATDSLIRVFLLVPGGLSNLFSSDFGVVYSMFVQGAALSYIEDVIALLISFLVGVPLLITVLKLR